MKSFIYFTLPLLIIISATASSANDTLVEPGAAQLSQLENGVRLLVLPQPDEQLVQVDIYLSLRGAARNGGMAHFVEHLMFRSTKPSPAGSLRDSFQLLTTSRNGSTTPRNIKTKTRCLPALLPRLLAVEAERYGQLQPDTIDVEHEKLRVIGEMDFRREVYTGMALHLRVIAMAYEEEGAGDPLLGEPEMIKAMTMEEIEAFIDHWFRPDRMVVLVSGPVQSEEVLGLVESTFGMIPPAEDELVLEDLPPHPGARQFITHSNDENDLLVVGFRLPYGNFEEAAIVHLTDTIMDRENGHPHLYIFEDEALLTATVWGHWSENKSDEEAAAEAFKQFWGEFKKVKRRVRNDWHFEKNRDANVKDLRGRVNNPFRSAIWRAQRLADDRELPAPEVMAAMIDTLDQAIISDFFAEQFTKERAFSSFAAGQKVKDPAYLYWNRYNRLRVNPYLNHTARSSEPGALSVTEVAPILAQAAASGVGKLEKSFLPNGIPLLVLNIPHSDEVYLGGVKTFPCLEDEASGRYPGRLFVYRTLVNRGYNRKGGAIKPLGKDLKRNTHVKVDINSLIITADGPCEKFANVAAVMHKRVDISKLQPRVFKWFLQDGSNLPEELLEYPMLQSWIWKTRKIFGADHPFANWLAPSQKSISKWSIGSANQMHWQLWKTGNLQLVVAGGVDLEKSTSLLSESFGRRKVAVPSESPIEAAGLPKTEGKFVHYEDSSMAWVQFMFPPQALGEESILGAADFLVMEKILTGRLNSAFKTAGFDSVNTRAMVFPAGYSALPYVTAICKPTEAGKIHEIIVQELARLQIDQPTDSEESTARAAVLGQLVEDLTDPESARDLLAEFGGFGKIPENILGDLCHQEYGILTARMPDYFSASQHAWTIVLDMSVEFDDSGENPWVKGTQ